MPQNTTPAKKADETKQAASDPKKAAPTTEELVSHIQCVNTSLQSEED
jgi:hypothetical protein